MQAGEKTWEAKINGRRLAKQIVLGWMGCWKAPVARRLLFRFWTDLKAKKPRSLRWFYIYADLCLRDNFSIINNTGERRTRETSSYSTENQLTRLATRLALHLLLTAGQVNRIALIRSSVVNEWRRWHQQSLHRYRYEWQWNASTLSIRRCVSRYPASPSYKPVIVCLNIHRSKL